MAFTQADLDVLDAAILQGGMVRTLSFQDQSVSFSSLDDMFRLRAIIVDSLAPAGTAPSNYRYVVTDKGV